MSSHGSARNPEVDLGCSHSARVTDSLVDQSYADQEAREIVELLKGQNQVLELIAQGRPLQETLDSLLRIVEQQNPGMLVSILLLDSDGKRVRHGAAPSLPESYTKAIDGEPIGPCAGSCGTAAYRGEPVIVEDIASDPLWADYKAVALQYGLRACWSTPIFDEFHRVLGTFAIYFRQPSRPDRRHLRQIAMVTYTAAIAIVKHRECVALVAADEKLRQLQEELHQAQKMESIGRLAGGVAHDFNNLVTVILGHVAFCNQKLPPESPLHSHLEQTRRAAERAAELTQHLLAFSRRQVIRPTVLDLNEVVSNLNKMMMRVISEDIGLRVVPASDLGSVRADLGQIDQILMNLVVNSVDAMPGGGQILIETSNAEIDEEYARSHSPVRPGSYVMLSVTDTGSGMDSRTVAQIFEPFFTTKAPGEGTGLGLSMVYGAVEQNHGHISVFSEPGKGTTFRIYFPRVDEVPAKIRESVEESYQTGSETILLVEDEELVRELTTLLLTEQGYKVLSAINGPSALVVAEQYPDKIHLLLTDIVMPHMTGPDLASRLKVHRPWLAVVYMSGYSGDLLSNHGILEAEAALLHKPFARGDLLRQISTSLGRTS